jgi:hypothetical protein
MTEGLKKIEEPNRPDSATFRALPLCWIDHREFQELDASLLRLECEVLVARFVLSPPFQRHILTESASLWDEAIRMVQLPEEQWKMGLAEYNKKVDASTRLLAGSVGSLPKSMREAWLMAKIRRVMFRAALTVAGGDMKQLKRFPDPAGFPEFDYSAFDGGFELRSRFKRYYGVAPPISLTVGTKPSRKSQ